MAGKMELIHYLVVFLSGGLLVLGATILAEKFKQPYLGGLLILLPSTTFVAIYWVGKMAGNEAASQLILGILLGVPVWIAFAISLILFLKYTSLISAMFWSFLVWLFGAIIFVYLKLHYLS